jgi:hypothetical protein
MKILFSILLKNLRVFHFNWIVLNILMGLVFKKCLQILQKKGYVKKNISPASSVILVKTLLKLSFKYLRCHMLRMPLDNLS